MNSVYSLNILTKAKKYFSAVTKLVVYYFSLLPMGYPHIPSAIGKGEVLGIPSKVFNTITQYNISLLNTSLCKKDSIIGATAIIQ